jgi:hypothetical protein
MMLAIRRSTKLAFVPRAIEAVLLENGEQYRIVGKAGAGNSACDLQH